MYSKQLVILTNTEQQLKNNFIYLCGPLTNKTRQIENYLKFAYFHKTNEKENNTALLNSEIFYKWGDII